MHADSNTDNPMINEERTNTTKIPQNVIPTRAWNPPLKLSDYALFHDDAITQEGDLVQYMAMLA